jgi:hypothetical protein
MVAICLLLFAVFLLSSLPGLATMLPGAGLYVMAAGVSLLAWFLALVFHEMGHVLVGWTVGMRFMHVEVGPLGVRRVGKKLQIYRTRRESLSGEASMRSPRIAGLRTRLVLMTFGGMLANLACICVAIPMFLAAAEHNHSGPWFLRLFWLAFGVVSVYFISISAESNTGRRVTDAKLIRDLVKHTEQGESDLLAHSLWSATYATPSERPRIIRDLIATFADSVPAEWLMRIFDLALDQGDPELIERSLGVVLAKDSSPAMRASVAFHASVRGRDLPLAARYLPERTEMGEDDFPVWEYAATMMALSAGRYKEGLEIAEAVLSRGGLDEGAEKWFDLAVKSSRRRLQRH